MRNSYDDDDDIDARFDEEATSRISDHISSSARAWVAADRIYSGAITEFYRWTALGTGVTGAVAGLVYFMGIDPALDVTWFLLAVVFMIVTRVTDIRHVAVLVVGGLYLASGAIIGVFLGIVSAYYGTSIVAAFAGIFGALAWMSVIGATQSDSPGLRGICLMALPGMVAGGLVSIILPQFSGPVFMVSVITPAVFMWITVNRGTRNVKKLAEEAAYSRYEVPAKSLALSGAVFDPFPALILIAWWYIPE